MVQTLADFKVNYTHPIPIHCDNTIAISVSKNPVLHSKTKHILIKYHFLKEKDTNRVVQLNYISSTEQIVDIFTKPLATTPFGYLRQKLGLYILSSNLFTLLGGVCACCIFDTFEMYCNNSGVACFFFDIDVKGGEKVW
jgi:hypothetical protein